MERSGISDGIDDVLKGMIENIDYKRLEELTESHMRINKGIQMKKESSQITNIEELIEYGNHEVPVRSCRSMEAGGPWQNTDLHTPGW